MFPVVAEKLHVAVMGRLEDDLVHISVSWLMCGADFPVIANGMGPTKTDPS